MNFGIIAEYNPFHKGHLYHICKSKEITSSENCVVIMSGNFVQRGEPAIFDKYTRTRFALLNGASVVIELPVIFACASADLFAYGAVNLLNSAGIIDFLCFGAENDNLEFLEEIGEIFANEPEAFKAFLKEELSFGISYPKARLNALSRYIQTLRPDLNYSDLSFLKEPNNILAIEYIKALKIEKSLIKPKIIKRKGSSFHQKEITSEIASSTGIRNSVKNLFAADSKKQFYIKEEIKKTIPENISDIFFSELAKIPKMENYFPVIDYILRTKTKEELSEILDITEGMENRIFKFRNENTIDGFLSSVKTKRYTLSKIRHALLHILLDIKKSDVYKYAENGLPYIRVLGFRKDKEKLLKELTEKSKVPVITTLKNTKKLSPAARSLLNMEIRASDIYYMTTTKEVNTDYTKPIVIV